MSTSKAVAHDVSGKYRLELEELRLNGFNVGWRWTVVDQSGRAWVVDSDTAHRDADAWCEAWAVVSMCLAAAASSPPGAYSIGVTQY